PVLSDLEKFHVECSRQQGLTGAEGGRCELHPYLVEEVLVGKLPGKIATTHDPCVLAVRCSDNFVEKVAHIALAEKNIGTGGNREFSARENEGRLFVRPCLTLGEKPFVC